MDAHDVKTLNYVIEKLQARFPGIPREVIAKEVVTHHETFHDARVRGFLGILVERQVADKLQARADASARELSQSA